MSLSNTLYNDLVIFILSMLPISEIRGSIIYGVAAMGTSKLSLAYMYIISVIGNFLPAPFILWLSKPVLKWLKKVKVFSKFAHWLEERTQKKASKFAKISAGALFVFVAIPFPTTGAWTGAMIAALLEMRYRYALPTILGGIMAAGLIMVLLCTGVWNFGALNNIILK